MQLHLTSSSLTRSLQGELFIVDITCAAGGVYNKKLMFKYSGISRLDEPGSYIIVRLQNTGIYRIYNPKALGCGARAK